MFGKSFVILLLLMTPGETRKSFLSFLNIQNSEILSFAKTEETVIIRSSYKDKRPNSSYLFVKLEDPKVLQVVNVTKTSRDVTDFTISLMTFPGETNMTIQLWISEVIISEFFTHHVWRSPQPSEPTFIHSIAGFVLCDASLQHCRNGIRTSDTAVHFTFRNHLATEWTTCAEIPELPDSSSEEATEAAVDRQN